MDRAWRLGRGCDSSGLLGAGGAVHGAALPVSLLQVASEMRDAPHVEEASRALTGS